jgi:hypothetical protein
LSDDVFWIDESSRETVTGLVYVVVGVRLAGDARSLARLNELLLPGQTHFHWRDETDPRRRSLVATLNELPIDVIAAVAFEVPRKRQEHARSQCVAALAQESLRRQSPVSDFAIEGRGAPLDRRDRFSIFDAARAVNHRPAPTVSFVAKSASPVLWVADAVASIASSHYSDEPRSDHWWRSLRVAKLTSLHVKA